MTHFDYARMSSTAGDFRNLTPLVLMSALQQAGTVVYEPIHRFRLETPADTFGPMLPALARLRAVPHAPVHAGLVVPAGGRDPGGPGARAAAAAAGADPRRRRAGIELRPLPSRSAARSRPGRGRTTTRSTARSTCHISRAGPEQAPDPRPLPRARRAGVGISYALLATSDLAVGSTFWASTSASRSRSSVDAIVG